MLPQVGNHSFVRHIWRLELCSNTPSMSYFAAIHVRQIVALGQCLYPVLDAQLLSELLLSWQRMKGN